MAVLEVEVAGGPPEGFIHDKVIVIIEGIDPADGKTTLWVGRSAQLKTWQSIGLLSPVLRLAEQTVVDEFIGNDDDG